MIPKADVGALNRNLVLSEILRRPTISRSAIGARLRLNAASVSRITRDLIDAGLVRETEPAESADRPGRRFVGLSVRGEGGYIVGIGLNAFRQSVTLADLENTKIAEWVSPDAPSPDGEAFMRICVDKAAEMVATHTKKGDRLFGIGMAVAADLDKEAGVILQAPTFGWTKPIAIADMITETLDVPLALEGPSPAINISEAYFGIGKDVHNVTTLYCSLGFGMGVRQSTEAGGQSDFGRVLMHARTPDGSGRKLDAACGGRSILNAVKDNALISKKSDAELGAVLVELIEQSRHDPELAALFAKNGRMAADYMSLTLDLIRPELLLIAGPLAASQEYFDGFCAALSDAIATTGPMPEITTTALTPTGASRWLALRAHVAMGNLDLAALKRKDVA